MKILKKTAIFLVFVLCFSLIFVACDKNEDEDDEPKYEKDMVFTFLDKNGAPITKREISFGNPWSNADVAYVVKTDKSGRGTIRNFPECEVTFLTGDQTGKYSQSCKITREILDSGEYTVVFQGYAVTK